MKFLILGDIFGRPGREAVKALLPKIKKEYAIDLCFANVENLSHGKGFTEKTVNEICQAGVDFCTSGNHVWKQKPEIPKLDDPDFPVIRPANYPGKPPGRGFQMLTKNGVNVLVINLLGQIFMPDHVDNPFHAATNIIESKEGKKAHMVIIDFHAEVTSEKIALAQYLDGRASLVYGTHTHVATNDARILKNGTGFISDVGFTGPIDSIIGLDKKSIIEQFLTGMPAKHEVAEGPVILNALYADIDDKTGTCISLEHIRYEKK